jgi:putative hydrolase of the HAD superfamily
MIETIAFDGDDTLWHNETLFTVTQARFAELLEPYGPFPDLPHRLVATESRNLAAFGYGIKGFMLSMIETAIEVTEGRVSALDIQGILDAGKAMREHPVELLDGVRDVVEGLVGGRHRLMVITKGDLFDQESKLAGSGLAELFDAVEIVSEKDEATYRRILARHSVDPASFLMVGNSLRSDVLPVVGVGARAVHVPYEVTWALEHVEPVDGDRPGVWELDAITDLPDLLAELDARS